MFPERLGRLISLIVTLVALGWPVGAWAQTPAFVLTAGGSTYSSSGGSVSISATFSYASASTLGFSLVLPSGWTYGAAGGRNVPAVCPASGDRGEIAFAYTTVPDGSATFSFTLNYSAGLTGTQTISRIVGSILPGSPSLPVTNLTFVAGTGPVISAQPRGATIAPGATVSFEVVAAGTGTLSYQWQKNGAAISGATMALFSIPVVQSSDAGTYAVVVTDALGSMTSSGALLVVGTGASVAFAVTPAVEYYSSEGGLARIDVGFTYANASAIGLAVTLPAGWTFEGASGANLPQVLPASGDFGELAFAYTEIPPSPAGFSFTLRYPAALTGDQILTRILASVLPQFSSVAVPDLRFRRQGEPVVGRQPATGDVLVGEAVTFSVVANAINPSAYQWRKDGSNIPGATLAVYQIASSKVTDGGVYSAIVTDDQGARLSTSASLTVRKRPAAVTLSLPTLTYDGTAKAASVMTNPSGLPVVITYGGSANLPVNAEGHVVVATINDPVYEGAGTGTLVIEKAPLTARAEDKTKVQGAANPVLTIAYTGLVNGETKAVITEPTIATAATTDSAAGTYPITLTGGSAANYALTTQGGTLTVAAKTVPVITWTPPAAVAYGTALAATQLNATASVGGTFGYSPTLGTLLGAGEHTLTATFTPTDTVNYAGATASLVLTVNKRPLTVGLQGAVTKMYDGTAAATLTAGNYQVKGAFGTETVTIAKTSGVYDTAGVGTGKTVTVPLAAGDFAAGTGTTLSNYQLPTSASGAIGSVTKAALTAKAEDKTKVYDGMAYSGGYSAAYSGFAPGETSALLVGTLGYSGPALTAVNAGSYAVTPGGLTSGNYDITCVPGQLVIGRRALTITANSDAKVFGATKAYGAGSTAFTSTGLVTGETIGTVTITASGGTAAADPAGSYALAPSAATGGSFVPGNYDITYVSGTLLVTVAAPTLSATQSYSGEGYFPGATVLITNSVTFAGLSSGLGFEVLLPSGWTLVEVGGVTGGVVPLVGTGSLLEFGWSPSPVSPATFTYSLKAPSSTQQPVSIAAIAKLNWTGELVRVLVQPDPLIINAAPLHSADIDRNGRINLMELTRVIELYNTRNGTARTGCYALATPATEDGFVADPNRASSVVFSADRYHSADSNRDGRVILMELTRVIELYNYRSGSARTGQYKPRKNTEDGFDPGPP